MNRTLTVRSLEKRLSQPQDSRALLERPMVVNKPTGHVKVGTYQPGMR